MPLIIPKNTAHPVILRPTTRVCHGCASVEIRDKKTIHRAEGFIKDNKWVIFPRLSYQNHLAIEQRLPVLGKEFSGYRFNTIKGSGKKAVASAGISSAYVEEALEIISLPNGEKPCHLHVATPFPFPEELALNFLEQVDEVPRHRRTGSRDRARTHLSLRKNIINIQLSKENIAVMFKKQERTP